MFFEGFLRQPPLLESPKFSRRISGLPVRLWACMMAVVAMTLVATLLGIAAPATQGFPIAAPVPGNQERSTSRVILASAAAFGQIYGDVSRGARILSNT
jgi:hypothetical protein